MTHSHALQVGAGRLSEISVTKNNKNIFRYPQRSQRAPNNFLWRLILIKKQKNKKVFSSDLGIHEINSLKVGKVIVNNRETLETPMGPYPPMGLRIAKILEISVFKEKPGHGTPRKHAPGRPRVF